MARYSPYKGSYKPKRYPRARGRGMEYHQLHRARWEAAHGEIPRWCVIHHRDEDTENWELENLECMTKAAHTSYHASDRACIDREHLEWRVRLALGH